MKILERNEFGVPRVVELTHDEQLASAIFDELLDDGKGVFEAALIACAHLQDDFYDWLAN